MNKFEQYYYGFIIENTGKKIKNFLQKEFNTKNFDITVDQWVILYQLYKTNDLSQREIANHTHKDPATVTRIIDLLCKKEYTERIPAKTDRRKFKINLTDFGKEKVEEFLPTVLDMRKKGWEGLTDKQYKEFISTLDLIFKNFN